MLKCIEKMLARLLQEALEQETVHCRTQAVDRLFTRWNDTKHQSVQRKFRQFVWRDGHESVRIGCECEDVAIPKYGDPMIKHTSTVPLVPALACRVNEQFRPTLQ